MKNKKIAVFANSWSNEYIANVLEGIREEASKDGVDIFFYTTYIFYGDDVLQSKCQLNIFHLPKPEDFDGAIMFTNTFNLPDETERILALFQRAGVPIVSTEIKLPGVGYIGTNNTAGMKQLSDHLIEKHGVKKVVYISGISGNEECAIRKGVLVESLKAHGLELADEFSGSFSFYTASENLKAWLDEGNRLPDAFVCANDQMAIGVVSILHERGYEVPKDVIVTGFDNIPPARKALPMIATVSKGGSGLGNAAYRQLKQQIEENISDLSSEYDSVFIPSESCGCEPSKEDLENRIESFRNAYLLSNAGDMLDIFCQELRVNLSKVASKEELITKLRSQLDMHDHLGADFCICTEPDFFELDDEEYPKRIRGYSKQMDVLYERRNGKSQDSYSFIRTENEVPGYSKVKGQSNLYIMVPLNNMDYIIGYVVIKNDTRLLYDLSLRKWIANMNSLFVNASRYIFAQKTNRKLKEIYMTDFLTGMYNRTGVEKVLFEFIQNEKQAGRTSLFMFVDIDCMKTINDVYGHLNGDLAIKAISSAMRNALPEDWLFGRYGGDEFVAVGSCLNEATVENKRQKISQIMAKKIKSYKLKFDLSASVGYAIIRPGDEGTIEEYIRIADQSMYEEKKIAHEKILANQAKED